ncbi:P1 family peptidase [Comamonas aquatica]|uniref:P1 family peptidase n=1 Tax=Comamonas aquatica TaxID=225991 RepID=A0AA42HZ25_9BURK|nr:MULTISPECIES: P1 family peptidase [Comamonas]MDH0362880.1 P1 family peptidase [Comamonas aquatica]MDH1765403.1 P1 family peptidase [Comamonas aquatica]MRT20110.1 P1 family peptidase [Comamonas sp. CAH-2]
MTATLLAHAGHIARVQGIQVGHFTDPRRPTGCSVVLCPQGAVGGVDVRGAAPGTRETDLLDPSHLVQQVHGITLSGGSAWGLDAASGTMRWLEEQGAGLDIGVGRIPLVPAAVLFDVMLGDMRIRPDAAAGYAACQAASHERPAEGSVGAGAGAVVGKIFGHARAMKGGIGTASFTVDGVTVGALVACNALGDVYHPHTDQLLAGARTADGQQLLGARDALLRGEAPSAILAGSNTTLGVVATDAQITKPQAQRLATVAHDGLARTINPVHTMSDGDTLFALGTGQSGRSLGLMTLFTLAAEAVALATARAILLAQSVDVAGQERLPSWADWQARAHA